MEKGKSLSVMENIKSLSVMENRKSVSVMENQTLIVDVEEDPDVQFLFDISKQVKHFYETPVIFLTHKDYSDDIFNILCSMRIALQNEKKTDIIDLIVDYHIKWLHAVNDIELFRKRINDLTRDEVYQAISFTIDAISSRLHYYQRYIAKYRGTLSNINQSNINADNEIVEEMHKDVTQFLLEKLKCFRNFDSDENFKIKVNDSIEDLLHWIDNINDSLTMLLSKYINVNVPRLNGDLTKTLQQIVDNLKNSKSPKVEQLLSELKIKGKELSTLIRGTAGHHLEINKVMEKINTLEERIARLEEEPSSAALLALTHKKEYLEKRLLSLENMKTTLKKIQETAEVEIEEVDDEYLCKCEDFFQLSVFSHVLPPEERERLVTELCHHWDGAVFGVRAHKSIISILSATDVKEEFTDDLGTFYIDEYSRKIYKIPEEEELHQINEMGKLVPLSDDSEHIYYYDECGRYYIDPKTRLRIYKAHTNASEYMMDNTGILLKLKEERDGVVYYYDNYGRYYINAEGKHIYREQDSMSEYENDGLGNLVRIRSHFDIFKLCPPDVSFTEDSKYLQLNVGKALRACIADAILHQPVDPIKYLSESLVKYRKNLEDKEKDSREKEELDIEREIKIAEERAAAERERRLKKESMLPEGGSEASYDSNLVKYTSMQPDDAMSASSK